MPEIEPIELSEFVKKAISDIERSVGRKLFDPIEIEISITKSQKLEGNLKLYVAGGGSETGKEAIAKMRFKVPPNLGNMTSEESHSFNQYLRLRAMSKIDINKYA